LPSLDRKATVALIAPLRFYAMRRQHNASESLSSRLLIPPVLVFALTLAAWFTLFH
jgi:hypothetical protein